MRSAGIRSAIVLAASAAALALCVPAQAQAQDTPLTPILDAVCSTAHQLEGDQPGALSELACLARAAELTYITELGPSGQAPLRREHAGLVNVPTLLDVDAAPGPDLVGTLRVTDASRVVLEVSRAPGAATALPVSVQVRAKDPQDPATRYTLGYDARGSSAPDSFTATVLLAASGLGIDVATTGAGETLALLGGRHQAGALGIPENPLSARADFSPVPAGIGIDLAFGEGTTSAELRVASQTDVGLAFSHVEDAGGTALAGSLKGLDGSVAVDLAQTAVGDGEQRVDIGLATTGPRLSRAEATLVQTAAGVPASTTEVGLEDLPSSMSATLAPAYGSEPQKISFSASEPAGVVEVARANGEPRRLADDRYAYVMEEAGFESTAARVTGLESVELELDPERIDVQATLEPGPFRVLLEEPGKRTEATAADLPGTVALDVRPAATSVDYTGSAPIGRLSVQLHDEAGIATSQATRNVAKDFAAHLQDVPRALSATLSPGGDDVLLDAGNAEIGRLDARLSTGPLTGTDSAFVGNLDSTSRDGALVRDVDDRYAVFARLSALRDAHLQLGSEPDVELRSGSHRDVVVSLARRTGDGTTEAIDATVRERPLCMRLAISSGGAGARCSSDGGSGDGSATRILYEGSERTGGIHLLARGLASVPGRKELELTLDGVPERLEATIDGGERLDLGTSGDPLDRLELRIGAALTLANELDGALLRLRFTEDSAGERVTELDRLLTRVHELRSVSVKLEPNLDVALDSVAARTFRVDVAGDRVASLEQSASLRPLLDDDDPGPGPLPDPDPDPGPGPGTARPDEYLTAELVRLMPNTTLTVRESAGAQKIAYDAGGGADSLTLDTNLTGGHNLHAEAGSVARSLDLCLAGSGSGCGRYANSLVDPNGPTVTAVASSPMNVNVTNCVEDSSDGGCTLGDDDDSFQRLRDFSVRVTRFQMHSFSESDIRVFLDTDNHSLSGDLEIRVPPGGKITKVIGTLPASFRAQNRKITIGKHWITGFPTQENYSGTINCPSAFNVYVVSPQFFGDANIELDGVLCDNPGG